MKFLFFDTETNGLPTSRYALTSEVEKWPMIVQIAWEVWNYEHPDDWVLEKSENYIQTPTPTDIVWNKESEAIHGISYNQAMLVGVSGEKIMEDFKKDAKEANVLVAHNLAFDKPVLRATYLRKDPTTTFDWWPGIEYCTMESTKMLTKLPSKYSKPHDPYKYPKLSELMMYLFQTLDDINFHSADQDVQCLVRCFKELVRRRLVPIEQWERRFPRRVLPTPATVATAEM